MKIYRIGIIGCGNIFKKHAKVLEQIDNCRLVSVADINVNRAMEAAHIYKCNWYDSYQEMIENEVLDAVHICLPHYLHADVAITCLHSDLDVVIEKPIALNIEQAFQIQRLSTKKKRRVMVVYQNRFIKTTKFVKEIVQSNQYGEVLGVSAEVRWNRNYEYYSTSPWRGEKKKAGGGVLITQAIHTLDLLEYLFGRLATVKGKCSNLDHDYIEEVEDTIHASLSFESGIKGYFFATTSNPYCVPASIEIIYSSAKIILTNNRVILEKDGKIEVLCENNDNDICYGNGHFLQLSSFYNENGDYEHTLSLEDAIRSIYLVNSVYESCDLEKRVDVSRYS